MSSSVVMGLLKSRSGTSFVGEGQNDEIVTRMVVEAQL